MLKDKSIVVIKYGGNAMTDLSLQESFAKDMVCLQQSGMLPVVVHGGGPQISQALVQSGHEVQFINGERVTDLKTLEIVEMVLCGRINKQIVQCIQNAGALAVGISGKDGQLMMAEVDPQKKQLGYVGTIKQVNTQLIHTLLAAPFIPIIAPVSTSKQGVTYNVNADFAAAAMAIALKAEKFLLLSNIPGVLDNEGKLIASIDRKKMWDLSADQTISAGMLPKVNCAFQALENGVDRVCIIDGRIRHVVSQVLIDNSPMGTMVVN